MLQPLDYAKNMVQQQRPISLNPMVMYRGVGANCINMGSCTMIQFAVGGKLKNTISSGNVNYTFSLQEEMTCGVRYWFRLLACRTKQASLHVEKQYIKMILTIENDSRQGIELQFTRINKYHFDINRMISPL